MSGGKEGGRSTELPLFGTPEKGERKKTAYEPHIKILSALYRRESRGSRDQ